MCKSSESIHSMSSKGDLFISRGTSLSELTSKIVSQGVENSKNLLYERAFCYKSYFKYRLAIEDYLLLLQSFGGKLGRKRAVACYFNIGLCHIALNESVEALNAMARYL